MKILYTAREVFDKTTKEEDVHCGGDGNCFLTGVSPWESYISWSRLYHLKELVTLDTALMGPAPGYYMGALQGPRSREQSGSALRLATKMLPMGIFTISPCPILK